MDMKKTIIILIIIFLTSLTGSVFAPNMPGSYDSSAVRSKMLKDKRLRDRLAYDRSLEDFKFALAQKESSNNWKKYNPYGYIGKFQFGQAALDLTGYGHVTFYKFIENPAVFPEKDQEIAMDSLLKFNEYVLKDYIEEYVGSYILDSILITRKGLLAASHLAGPGNVKRFINSNGSYNPMDQLGTRLSDYLITFARH